jgi:hypothetical protein
MGIVDADMMMDEWNSWGEYECRLVFESDLRDRARYKQRSFAVRSRGAAYMRKGKIRGVGNGKARGMSWIAIWSK